VLDQNNEIDNSLAHGFPPPPIAAGFLRWNATLKLHSNRSMQMVGSVKGFSLHHQM
jgi:hypothetical protein